MASKEGNPRKAQIDAVLLRIPGVTAKKIGGLDGYFVNDRMFACISGSGIGLRLPVATAREPWFAAGFIAAALGLLGLLTLFGGLVRWIASKLPRPRNPIRAAGTEVSFAIAVSIESTPRSRTYSPRKRAVVP